MTATELRKRERKETALIPLRLSLTLCTLHRIRYLTSVLVNIPHTARSRLLNAFAFLRVASEARGYR